MHNSTPTILAIDPGARAFGFAVLSAQGLRYFGVKTVRQRQAPHTVLQEIARLLEKFIAEYQPTMLHSKTLVVDGLFATIGSINVDVLSMSKNQEESLSFYDRPLADSVEAMFQRDLARSHEVTYESWRHRGVTTRIFELLSWIWEPYY